MRKTKFLVLLFSALSILSFITYPVYARSAESHPALPDGKDQQASFYGYGHGYGGGYRR